MRRMSHVQSPPKPKTNSESTRCGYFRVCGPWCYCLLCICWRGGFGASNIQEVFVLHVLSKPSTQKRAAFLCAATQPQELVVGTLYVIKGLLNHPKWIGTSPWGG